MEGFRRIWIVFIVLIVLIFGANAYFFANAKSKGEHVYYITVHNYSSTETYITDSYKLESGCLKFIDSFGIETTVCGNYSISEW